MKFGGASVETLSHFSRVADLIKQRKDQYSTVVVVVSAMRGVTDKLIEMAYAVNPVPPRREYDMLVTVGERMSCSLLAMALDVKNIKAVSFTGSQAGIITTEEHSEAKIIEVRPHRLVKPIDEGQVIVVAGFQGVSRSGAITSLGRGGSDTTAVALAVALKGEVEFYKDVPGLFNEDPKKSLSPVHYPSLTYDEALELIHKTGNVLHPRCVHLAAQNNIHLRVMSFNDSQASYTLISNQEERVLQSVYEESTQEVAYA